jgi:hypothetical protein
MAGRHACNRRGVHQTAGDRGCPVIGVILMSRHHGWRPASGACPSPRPRCCSTSLAEPGRTWSRRSVARDARHVFGQRREYLRIFTWILRVIDVAGVWWRALSRG